MTPPFRFLLIAAAVLAIGSTAAHNHNPEKRTEHQQMMIERKTAHMTTSLALTDVQ